MAKHKHSCASVDIKLQALVKVDKKIKSKAEIADEYGVPASTLSTWIKKTVNLSYNLRESLTHYVNTARTKHAVVDAELVL